MHKALGRGLESLLQSSSAPVVVSGETVLSLAIEKIKTNRNQPRKHFNEAKIRELSESIKNHGLAQPLLVTPSVIPGEYDLIAGERRLRACQMAGIKEVATIVRKVTPKEKFELSLVENIQREDLNSIEEAKAYSHLSAEFKLTQEDLARILGKDRSVVANCMRLLNLPVVMQGAISGGEMSSGHGRMLAGVEDKSKQKLLFEKILKDKLSVREVERIVSDWKSGKKEKKKINKKKEPELMQLSEELQRRLGTKVNISGKAQKGKIEIHYFSLDELERISALLKTK